MLFILYEFALISEDFWRPVWISKNALEISKATFSLKKRFFANRFYTVNVFLQMGRPLQNILLVQCLISGNEKLRRSADLALSGASGLALFVF